MKEMFDNCHDIQESLPHYLTGQLREEANAALGAHVADCAECRAVMIAQLPLFELAAAGSESTLLDEHPSGEDLDRFCFDSDQLSAPDHESIKQHVESCQVCGPTVAVLRELPRSANQIASAEETPEMNRFDAEDDARVTDIRPNGSGWLRTTAVLAAAAMVAFVIISRVLWPPEPPVATVEVVFSEALRGDSSPLLVESAGPVVRMQAIVFVDPEPGHTYRLLVNDAQTEQTAWSRDSLTQFDNLGFYHFEAMLDTGTYDLLVEDILGNDTVVIATPFKVVGR